MFWVVFFGIIFIAIVANVAYRMKTGKRWVVSEKKEKQFYEEDWTSDPAYRSIAGNIFYEEDWTSDPAYRSIAGNIFYDPFEK